MQPLQVYATSVPNPVDRSMAFTTRSSQHLETWIQRGTLQEAAAVR